MLDADPLYRVPYCSYQSEYTLYCLLYSAYSFGFAFVGATGNLGIGGMSSCSSCRIVGGSGGSACESLGAGGGSSNGGGWEW